jgi:hypothetical protein
LRQSFKHALVAKMHTIKVANGDCRRPGAEWNTVRNMLHSQ